MKLNCLIIDDEPMARKGIAEYVTETDFLTLAGQCEDAVKAAVFLQDQPVDLIFLDIQMPRVSGISFLKSLKKPPLVIFTTAFSEYALEGYELDVVDYLLKPISFDRFLKAAQKAFELHEQRTKDTGRAPAADYFFVKTDGKFEKVRYDELRFVEGMQNYIILHTTTRKLITYMTLSGLDHQLPRDRFLKVHKSYLVGIGHVDAIDGSDLVIGSSRVPISRTLKDEVVRQILGNKLFKR